ncbi:MAG: flagellar filament outer layer protein FlaA [Treponema sp.]|nr:flagellar filament outer layer protein FlaA [Treponema sp.]
MKHSGIKALGFVGLTFVAVLALPAQETRPTALNTIVLDSFNGDAAKEWHDGRQVRSYNFTWGLQASPLASKSTENGTETAFPRSTYVDAWPRALFGDNRNGDQLRSFGVNGRFDRQGHNWVDIYPVSDGKPFEIPMPGRVRNIDLWVWGSNLKYDLELYVRDSGGIVHRIRLGNINYSGWRNLTANIPNTIRQDNRVLPAHAQLHFVKFRLWTQPNERVDNFFVYFNRLQILTDVFEDFFDGDELADPDLLTGFWND